MRPRIAAQDVAHPLLEQLHLLLSTIEQLLKELEPRLWVCCLLVPRPLSAVGDEHMVIAGDLLSHHVNDLTATDDLAPGILFLPTAIDVCCGRCDVRWDAHKLLDLELHLIDVLLGAVEVDHIALSIDSAAFHQAVVDELADIILSALAPQLLVVAVPTLTPVRNLPESILREESLQHDLRRAKRVARHPRQHRVPFICFPDCFLLCC